VSKILSYVSLLQQEEMERLKTAISKLQSGEGEEDSEEKVRILILFDFVLTNVIPKERLTAIGKQLEADKEKLQKIRLLLARKNREIALLQRKIDEVPSRTELTQYQRRFIELYGQGMYRGACTCVLSPYCTSEEYQGVGNTIKGSNCG